MSQNETPHNSMMPEDEMITAEAAVVPAIRLLPILGAVEHKRSTEFWKDFGKIVLILAISMLGGLFVVAGLGGSEQIVDLIYHGVVLLIPLSILLAFWFVILWPFWLYFWSNIKMSRSRTLLTLIQTSLETNTPLSRVIRCHSSAVWSPWFREKLNLFADALDYGYSIGDSLKTVPGLVRYDLVGAFELGGDNRQLLKMLERSIDENQHYSMFHSYALMRVFYLVIVLGMLFQVSTFLMFWIIPQFEKIYADFGMTLPTLTRFVITIAPICMTLLALASPFLFIFLLVYLVAQTGLFTFRPPGFRKMFANLDSSRFLQVFNVGMTMNRPMTKTLETYCAVSPSVYLVRRASRVLHHIENGVSWIQAVLKERFINKDEARLLESAERTGNVSHVLGEIVLEKEQKQNRRDDAISRFVFLPCILLVGLFVGMFVIGMFLPMIELINELSF